MNQAAPPFTCTYTPNVPELLRQLKCSLIISTYQAGKTIVISALDKNSLIQLPRHFEKPMGIAIDADRMAIASKSEVLVLSKSAILPLGYPEQPGKYDFLYSPRATYYTGPIDAHDLVWGNAGLWAVNTRFSCLSIIDDHYSFTPKWQPSFITDLVPDDRCHLNGLAMQNGKPAYVTALGKSDVEKGWRANKASGGILMDVASKEIILQNLSMPHSPRIYNNALYLLISGTGELAEVDTTSGKYSVITTMPGFARGMDLCGDYLFIGLSKLRTDSKDFQNLPVSKNSISAGVMIVYLPTGEIAGSILYENSVEEIFDVKVLPGMKRPGIINTSKNFHQLSIVTPTDAFWLTPEVKE